MAKIVQQNCIKHEPRGDSAAGATARWKEHMNEYDEPCKTLQHLLRKKKSVIDTGKQKIDKYVERNVCTEMHRAFAIQVLTAGVTLWGLGIVEAASRAADVTGVSAYTVQKWASQ